MKKKQIFLLVAVLFLFTFSMYKTYKFLDIQTVENEDAEAETSEKNKDERKITNCQNSNFFQTEERGDTLFDGDYIYYNNLNYLVKYDISTKEETPISTGVNLKSMVSGDNSIIGVATFANGNDILCDYVVEAPKDGGSRTVYYKTESSYITSVMYDGEYIYYTNESHNIYKIEDNETSVYYKDKSDYGYPILIGIKDSKLYYVNTANLSYIDLQTDEETIVSEIGISPEQKPMLNGNYVYFLTDLKQDSLSRINLSSGNTELVVGSEYIKNKIKKDKIDNFNIIDNFLFINCDGYVYYKNTQDTDEMKLYKKTDSNELNVTYESLYYQDNSLSFNYLTWIISG